jgi:pre-mRNA-splicing factor ATP-dependent RNA helicase DHX15/PRP43
MADRRPENQEMSSTKRVKMERNMDPTSNPYLAHHYNGNGGEYASTQKNTSLLANFERHNTTAEQAHKAEDGPSNPFNGAPLSSTYFSILKTRRDLPVHKQRQVLI